MPEHGAGQWGASSGAKVVALGLALVALAGCEGSDLTGVVDLSGRPVDPFAAAKSKVTVAIFVDTDCPVSNRYAPAVRRLHETFSPRGVHFWLVYPDPGLAPEAIREHLSAYQYPMRALRDPEHRLVRLARVRVTPEAGVFLPDGELIYHGRIDDRFVDFNRRRPAPTRRDVEEVLDAVLRGQSVRPTSRVAGGRALSLTSNPGVGCFISDLE